MGRALNTATEVRIRLAQYERRVAPVMYAFRRAAHQAFIDQLALLTKRRRKSKGWRRHVRRLKAQQE